MKKVNYKKYVRVEDKYGRYEEMCVDEVKIIDDDGLRYYGLKDIEGSIKEYFEDMGRFDVEVNIYNLI